jgi:precorrin-6A/cobalt-precorrin-6A reductase
MPMMDSQGWVMSFSMGMMARAAKKVLVLGGTSEASALALRLASVPGREAMLSYAGRTETPRPPPIPWRVGGFGGAEGLARFLIGEGIDRLVDATHPFAASMSANAIAAATITGVPLLALERPAWKPQPGDTWRAVPDLETAALELGTAPRRVFLAIGRLHLSVFATQPQHHYVLRLIDPPREELPLPNVTTLVARGPFNAAGDEALLRQFGIDTLVAKNAGGTASEAKIIAARKLGIGVIMVDRPWIAPRPTVETVDEVMAWLAHDALAVGAAQ